MCCVCVYECVVRMMYIYVNECVLCVCVCIVCMLCMCICECVVYVYVFIFVVGMLAPASIARADRIFLQDCRVQNASTFCVCDFARSRTLIRFSCARRSEVLCRLFGGDFNELLDVSRDFDLDCEEFQPLELRH